MNHQKIVATSLLTLFVGCGLLSFSNQALAVGDVKMYSGAECKPNGTTTATGLVYTAEGIKNTSAGIKTVICPLVRDSELNYGASAPAFLEVRGSRLNMVGVGCSVVRWDITETKGVPANGSGAWAIQFDGGPFNKPGPTNGSPVSLVCVLGAGVSITSYRLVESGVTEY